jgi:hypothetical protein
MENLADRENVLSIMRDEIRRSRGPACGTTYFDFTSEIDHPLMLGLILLKASSASK